MATEHAHLLAALRDSLPDGYSLEAECVPDRDQTLFRVVHPEGRFRTVILSHHTIRSAAPLHLLDDINDVVELLEDAEECFVYDLAQLIGY